MPWLRPSEYITARFDEKLYGQNTGTGGAVELDEVVHKSAKGSLDARVAFAKAAVELVTRQFERTNDGSPPVHPTNPSLKPVFVQPLYPNYDFLGSTLTHVLYEDLPPVEKDAAAEREKALLLPVFWQTQGARQEQGFVRVLPNDDDAELDELFGEAEAAEDGVKEYHKTAAYHYHMSKTVTWQLLHADAGHDVKLAEENESKYVWVWGEGVETAGYVPLELKIDLHDFSTMKRGTAPTLASRYKVAKRDMQHEMEGESDAKYQKLFADNDDEDAAAVAAVEAAQPMQEGDDIDLNALKDDDEAQVPAEEEPQASQPEAPGE